MVVRMLVFAGTDAGRRGEERKEFLRIPRGISDGRSRDAKVFMIWYYLLDA